MTLIASSVRKPQTSLHLGAQHQGHWVGGIHGDAAVREQAGETLAHGVQARHLVVWVSGEAVRLVGTSFADEPAASVLLGLRSSAA